MAYLNENVTIYDSTLTKIEHKGKFKKINEYGHAIIESESKEISVLSGRMRRDNTSKD